MINRVILVGRLTRDPELRYTPNGNAVTTFTLAVNRPFTNQQGERDADFVQIVVWRKSAEACANYLRKGSLAGIDGRIQTRNYEDQDGKRVYVTEVVAESVQFLEPKSKGQARTQKPSAGQAEPSAGTSAPTYDDPFADAVEIDISDDDLPF